MNHQQRRDAKRHLAKNPPKVEGPDIAITVEELHKLMACETLEEAFEKYGDILNRPNPCQEIELH